MSVLYARTRFKSAEAPHLRIEDWKHAIRIKMPKFKCFQEHLEVKEQAFDYYTKYGILIATKIVTENIGDYQYPADWWEAFKERWFPFFLIKRFPVKYQGIDIKAIYPKCSMNDPVFKMQVKQFENENLYKKP